MHLFIRTSWHLATAGMLLGAVSFTSDPHNEEDLLDPSLDRPLPQYESTRDAAFKPLSEIPKPTLVDSQPQPSRVIDNSSSGSLEPSRGAELAPNPLQKLIGGQSPAAQPSPSDIQLEKPAQAAPRIETRKRVPRVQRTPVETTQPLAKPPGYSSPFNPKPITPPQPKPTFRKSTPEKSPSLKSKTKSKQTQKNKKKKVASLPRQPEVNYNIYRDPSAYPLDPRKPNNPCTGNCQGGNCGCGCAKRPAGLHGRPYQPHEPGGYACGKNCPNKHPQFSPYWPRPFSAKLDESHPERAAARYSGCPQKKLTDVFDRLVNFRLVDYQRTDNGYCGPGRDPYGCLGESKVAGLGFRVQSVPNEPNVPTFAYPIQ